MLPVLISTFDTISNTSIKHVYSLILRLLELNHLLIKINESIKSEKQKLNSTLISFGNKNKNKCKKMAYNDNNNNKKNDKNVYPLPSPYSSNCTV